MPFGTGTNGTSMCFLGRVQTQPAYGVPPVLTVGDIIWNICKVSFVPVVLLIGFIIYFKKSKDSNKGKIIVILTILAIVALLYFVIDYYKVIIA